MNITQYARLYGTQAVAVIAFAIVVLGIVVVIVARRTPAGAQRRRAVKSALLIVVMALGAGITILVALTPAMSTVVGDGVEWNPLVGFENDSPLSGSHIVGNLLMLSWLGLCLPALWHRVSWAQTVAIVAGTSFLIEAAQFALVPGRVAATQDLILNVIGGAIAAAVGVSVVRPWVSESAGQ